MTAGTAAHTETRTRTALATIKRAWPHLHNPPKQPGTHTTNKPGSRPPTNLHALNLRTHPMRTLRTPHHTRATLGPRPQPHPHRIQRARTRPLQQVSRRPQRPRQTTRQHHQPHLAVTHHTHTPPHA